MNAPSSAPGNDANQKPERPMKNLHLPSGLTTGTPFILPEHWSPEQALAVVELLDDLRHQIWAHYQLPLLDIVREQRMPSDTPDDLNEPMDDPPF